MRALLVCDKGGKVYKREMGEVICRIESKCWREAVVFEFLYNWLVKSKKKTWNLYILKSHRIGVFPPRSLRHLACVILVRSSRVKETFRCPIRKVERIVELLMPAYQPRMISGQTSGFKETILCAGWTIRAPEGPWLCVSSRTFKAYDLVPSSPTPETFILHPVFLRTNIVSLTKIVSIRTLAIRIVVAATIIAE
jgi:hypothetical protein